MNPQQQNPTLSDQQKAVLFDKATEAPFTGKYVHTSDDGIYICANCGHVLFDAKTKFDAHCGWPSFFDIADQGAVKLQDDNSLGMQRTEVLCANCGGHLGHLFEDAPDQPTGLRYCINSASLDLKPRDSAMR